MTRIPFAPVPPPPPVVEFSHVRAYQIHSTLNYAMFEAHPENRVILDENGRIKKAKLERTMRLEGFRPTGAIVVVIDNTRKILRVVEGHNRFYIATQLGLPIWFGAYPQQDEITPRAFSEAQSPWTQKDLIRSHLKDSPDYAEVMDYHARTKFTTTACFNFFRAEVASNTNHHAAVRDGTYQIRDRVMPAKMEAVARSFDPSYSTTMNYAIALSRVYLGLPMQFDELASKIAKYPHKRLAPVRTTEEAMMLLQQTYNFGKGEANEFDLATATKKAMANRQSTFGKGGALMAETT